MEKLITPIIACHGCGVPRFFIELNCPNDIYWVWLIVSSPVIVLTSLFISGMRLKKTNRERKRRIKTIAIILFVIFFISNITNNNFGSTIALWLYSPVMIIIQNDILPIFVRDLSQWTIIPAVIISNLSLYFYCYFVLKILFLFDYDLYWKNSKKASILIIENPESKEDNNGKLSTK
jgi:hypothetical protein